MDRIPKQQKKEKNRITPTNIDYVKDENENVLFSFEILERNEYFNLDGTCVNWSSDLFETMKKVSQIPMKDIRAGLYSGKQTPLRIHCHENAKPPCKVPDNISLEELWQIRISLSKGGIHGMFVRNIFYIIWLDPQHNLYPDKNHGGLTKIKPLSNCCKERDEKIAELNLKIQKAEEEVAFYKEYIGILEEKN